MNTRFAGEKLHAWNPFHWKEMIQRNVDNAIDTARSNPHQQMLGGSGMHGNRELMEQIKGGY